MVTLGAGAAHGVEISYVTQETQDGTGRVVELAKDFAEQDPFILSYGDILVAAEEYAGLADLAGDDAVLTIKRAPEEEVSKGGSGFCRRRIRHQPYRETQTAAADQLL